MVTGYRIVYTKGMETETFTISIIPVGDHLEVTVPEIGVTIETGPGETRRDEAVDAAHRAINEYLLKQYEKSQALAS